MDNLTRIAEDDRVGRDITVDECVRSYENVIPDSDLPDDGAVDSDPDLITDGRSPLAASSVLLTYRNPLMDIDITAQNGITIYRNPVRMTYIQSLPNPHRRRDVYMVHEACKVIKPSVQRPHKPPRRRQFPIKILIRRAHTLPLLIQAPNINTFHISSILDLDIDFPAVEDVPDEPDQADQHQGVDKAAELDSENRLQRLVV